MNISAHTQQPWRTRAAAAVVAVASGAALIATTAAPAHAWCDGSGNPHDMRLTNLGYIVGWLVPASDTCNNNNWWSGRLYDTAADGQGVNFYAYDYKGGSRITHEYVGGYGNDIYVSFRDPDGFSYMKLRVGGLTKEAWSYTH